ncbi:uncharacterized protein LOC144143035 [Haemaphysalis longicornis]
MKRFVTSVRQIVSAYELDGVAIHWVTPEQRCVDAKANSTLEAILEAIRDHFKQNGLNVTIAVFLPADANTSLPLWTQISLNVDFAFIETQKLNPANGFDLTMCDNMSRLAGDLLGQFARLGDEKISFEVVAEMPTFASFKNAMYRERRRHQPELPASADDVQLSPLYQQTEDGRLFLAVNDSSVQGSRILAFAFQEALKHLSSAKMVFLDSTFFEVPQIFDQLLTIHVMGDGKHSPAIYFLLCGRSRETYVRAFESLRNLFAASGITFPNTDIFLTDFEQALIAGARTVFLGAAHRACHFHFTQRVTAAGQKAGLQTAYGQDDSLRSLLRKMVALSFLPVSVVHTAWQFLRQECISLGILADITVLNYFGATWMNGPFNIEQWNHYGNRSPRSNNHMESWHRKINAVSGRAHHNIYSFIDLIKRDEALTRVSLQQLANGGAVRDRGHKWINKNRQLAELESQFSVGLISAYDFLNKAKTFSGL